MLRSLHERFASGAHFRFQGVLFSYARYLLCGVPIAAAVRATPESGVRRCRDQRFDAYVCPVKTKTRGGPKLC